MEAARDEKKIVAVERLVLQAMCQGTPERTVWDDGMLILGSYPFHDVVHQLLFDTLGEINTDLPPIIRQQLPARVTLKGFPALDLAPFFQPHPLNAAQAVALMHQLRAWSKGEERMDSTVR